MGSHIGKLFKDLGGGSVLLRSFRYTYTDFVKHTFLRTCGYIELPVILYLEYEDGNIRGVVGYRN